jgi:hypothetical protein
VHIRPNFPGVPEDSARSEVLGRPPLMHSPGRQVFSTNACRKSTYGEPDTPRVSKPQNCHPETALPRASVGQVARLLRITAKPQTVLACLRGFYIVGCAKFGKEILACCPALTACCYAVHCSALEPFLRQSLPEKYVFSWCSGS